MEESPVTNVERPASVPINVEASQQFDPVERPSRMSSVNSSIHSKSQTKRRSRTESVHQESKTEQYVNDSTDDQTLSQKGFSNEQNLSRTTLEKRPYNHDMLVIQHQPTKVIRKNFKKIKSLVYDCFINSLNHYRIYSMQYNFKEIIAQQL